MHQIKRGTAYGFDLQDGDVLEASRAHEIVASQHVVVKDAELEPRGLDVRNNHFLPDGTFLNRAQQFNTMAIKLKHSVWFACLGSTIDPRGIVHFSFPVGIDRSADNGCDQELLVV